MSASSASFYIRKDRKLPQPDGSFFVRYGASDSGLIASVQPDGSIQSRHESSGGSWETFRQSGSLAYVADSAYPLGAWAFPSEA